MSPCTAESDGGQIASDERESVDGAFGDGDDRGGVDGVAIEKSDGHGGIVAEASGFVDVADSASGIIIAVVGDYETFGFLVECDVIALYEVLIIAAKAALMKVIDGYLRLKSGSPAAILECLRVIFRFRCGRCRSDASEVDGAVDGVFGFGREPFDFGDDVNNVAVEVTGETVNGMGVGVELHRGVVVDMIFADALEHAVVIGRVSDVNEVIEEMRFSGIEVCAVERVMGVHARRVDGRRVDGRLFGACDRVDGRRVDGGRVSRHGFDGDSDRVGVRLEFRGVCGHGGEGGRRVDGFDRSVVGGRVDGRCVDGGREQSHVGIARDFFFELQENRAPIAVEVSDGEFFAAMPMLFLDEIGFFSHNKIILSIFFLLLLEPAGHGLFHCAKCKRR